MRRSFFSLFFFLFAGMVLSHGQEDILEGIVVDSATEEPLAFVNVTYGKPARGTTTDIDGQFSLSIPSGVKALHFSYVGYSDTILYLREPFPDSALVISMKQKPYSLEEVMVRPGKNPANRIIKQAYENREQNDPENLSSFTYRSYNKIVFNIDSASRAQPPETERVDSSVIRLREMMEKQHFMLMETVTRRKYMKPARNREEVLASRVSGFKDPSLSFLATQFQSFSFYNDFIELGNDQYLNPISKNSWNRYFFLLEDTLYTPRADTVYVISYRPKRGRGFEALEGLLHINTHGYALQKVIAEPWNPPADLSIRIQQQYELVGGEKWFPRQLNTRLKFKNVLLAAGDKDYFLIGEGKTYIYDTRLNPELDKRDFGHVELSVPPDAYERSSAFWHSHRTRSLTPQDRRTYRFVDSLGRAHNFDRRLDLFETLSSGYLPAGMLSVDLRRILGYNKYEGLRLGLGLRTSREVSTTFALSGYLGYGLRDRQYKYGGELELNLHEESEAQLQAGYFDDVVETGGYRFLNQKSFLSDEMYRDYLVENMDRVERSRISVSFRIFDYLKFQGFLQHSRVDPYSDYGYDLGDRIYSGRFHITETGFRLRYAYGEDFIKTHRGKYSLGTDAPVVYGNIIRGIKGLKGDFSYTKYEGAISERIQTRSLGNTHIRITGGYAVGDVPAFNLYSGHGSYGSSFSIYSGNSFATMRLDEFRAERFVSAFLSHNFRSIFHGSSVFNPHLIWANHAGWGWPGNPGVHQNAEMQGFEKGFFETGILLNRLISTGFFHYGLGVFYRYGPYAFEAPARNFAWKFSFRLAFN